MMPVHRIAVGVDRRDHLVFILMTIIHSQVKQSQLAFIDDPQLIPVG